jgi:hypothetical protein
MFVYFDGQIVGIVPSSVAFTICCTVVCSSCASAYADAITAGKPPSVWVVDTPPMF